MSDNSSANPFSNYCLFLIGFTGLIIGLSFWSNQTWNLSRPGLIIGGIGTIIVIIGLFNAFYQKRRTNFITEPQKKILSPKISAKELWICSECHRSNPYPLIYCEACGVLGPFTENEQRIRLFELQK